MRGETVLILGGYGLVGMQIARTLARSGEPGKIVLASLRRDEAEAAAAQLASEFPALEVVCCHGNLFVREEFSHLSRPDLLSSDARIRQLYEDSFGTLRASEPSNISNECLLVKVIRRYRPDVIVDAVNTATGISYQDVKSSTERVFKFHDSTTRRLAGLSSELLARAEGGDPEAVSAAIEGLRELKRDYDERLGIEDAGEGLENRRQMYVQLISQIVPQLVRHVVLLHKVCQEVGTRVYLKIGTTGTGGMGLNIPYTHGEDRPSFQLLAKASVGFAHSGLLFLLARTPGPTIFKEIKPASLIGYRKVDVRSVSKWGCPVELSMPRSEQLSALDTLDTCDPEEFSSEGELRLAGVDTGENGFFARGEFEAITYLGQMEFVTPQEIAERALHEIAGRNTGKDVVQGLSGSVLDPSYRGGFLRPIAIADLDRLENESETPSVAIGQLGPPQLTKLLFESHLLARVNPTISGWMSNSESDEQIAERLYAELKAAELDRTITSIGVPIRLPDGDAILRGPRIAIPESVERMVPISGRAQVDAWTEQGWVDLRPSNVARWRRRFAEAVEVRELSAREGSALFSRQTYPYDEIRTGEIVGWIFNHEPLLGADCVGGRLW
jgi:hypothetical protein